MPSGRAGQEADEGGWQAVQVSRQLLRRGPQTVELLRDVPRTVLQKTGAQVDLGKLQLLKSLRTVLVGHFSSLFDRSMIAVSAMAQYSGLRRLCQPCQV